MARRSNRIQGQNPEYEGLERSRQPRLTYQQEHQHLTQDRNSLEQLSQTYYEDDGQNLEETRHSLGSPHVSNQLDHLDLEDPNLAYDQDNDQHQDQELDQDFEQEQNLLDQDFEQPLEENQDLDQDYEQTLENLHLIIYNDEGQMLLANPIIQKAINTLRSQGIQLSMVGACGIDIPVSQTFEAYNDQNQGNQRNMDLVSNQAQQGSHSFQTNHPNPRLQQQLQQMPTRPQSTRRPVSLEKHKLEKKDTKLNHKVGVGNLSPPNQNKFDLPQQGKQTSLPLSSHHEENNNKLLGYKVDFTKRFKSPKRQTKFVKHGHKNKWYPPPHPSNITHQHARNRWHHPNVFSIRGTILQHQHRRYNGFEEQRLCPLVVWDIKYGKQHLNTPSLPNTSKTYTLQPKTKLWSAMTLN